MGEISVAYLFRLIRFRSQALGAEGIIIYVLVEGILGIGKRRPGLTINEIDF